MELIDREIADACADIASAVDEAGLAQLDAQLSCTCFAGRLARFLNALRCDTKSKTVTRRLLERFAARSNINIGGIEDLRDFLGKLGAGKQDDEGNFTIILESVEAVYAICATYWRRKTKNKEGSADALIVPLLKELYLPAGLPHLRSSLGEQAELQACLEVLMRLGLVLEEKRLGSYFATKYFGKRTEPVAAFLDRTKGASADMVTLIGQIQEKQGFPLDDVPVGLREQTQIATGVGLLEPVEIVVAGKRVTFLFTPGDVDDKIYLSKETTAHFRYNEKYADPSLGRLWNTPRFLEKLIANGTAGEADNIGTNYKALEEKGVVVARPGGLTGRPTMVARKVDVLKDTLATLQSSEPLAMGKTSTSLAEWIKNPVEGRLVGGKPFQLTKRASEELVRSIRDEMR